MFVDFLDDDAFPQIGAACGYGVKIPYLGTFLHTYLVSLQVVQTGSEGATYRVIGPTEATDGASTFSIIAVALAIRAGPQQKMQTITISSAYVFCAGIVILTSHTGLAHASFTVSDDFSRKWAFEPIP